MDPPSTDRLGKNQDIDCQPNSVVWIGQAPFWTYGQPSYREYSRAQENCQDLKPNVYSDCPSVLRKSYDKDCGRDYEKEGDCGNHSMTSNENVVLRQISEAISHSWSQKISFLGNKSAGILHTIVAHGLKVQSYEIREQE